MYLLVFHRIIYKEAKDEESSGRATPIVTLYPRNINQSASVCTVEDVLQLLRHVYVISASPDDKKDKDETLVENHMVRFFEKKKDNFYQNF